MRSIETAVDIAAPPETVWHVVADFGSYGAWNPSIDRVEGDQRIDAPLVLHVRLPGVGRLTLNARLHRFLPGEEMSWRGHFLSPALMHSEHRFIIEALPNGRARLTQVEFFSGALGWLFVAVFANRLQVMYATANQNLKQMAEAVGRSAVSF